MAPAILTISGSGGITPTGTININTNGTHNVTTYASANVSVPASAVDTGTKSISISSNGTTTHDVVGYASVSVTANVPNSYSTSDEGKVVSSGALVSQTSDTVTANDTYDTTLINSLTVNVSGGGSGDLAEVNDVTFIDYDGRVLYSYTKSEFLALSAMPPNPTHTGLIAQGWNWTLAQAKAFVTDYDCLCIGQVYTTSDTKTHAIVDIDETMVGLEFRIRLYTSVKNGVTVDWGDGNTSVTTGNVGSISNVSHYYDTANRYDITIYATSGTYELGYNGSNASIFHNNDASTRVTCQGVKALYIGKDCTRLHRTIIWHCYNVEEVTIPKTVTLAGDRGSGANGLLSSSVKLKGIVIPSETVLATLSIAEALPALRFISVGYGSISSTTSATRVTSEVRELELLTLRGVTSFVSNGNVAYDVRAIKRYAVDGTYTNIYGQYLRNTCIINKVVIPSSVTNIADYAFSDAYICELHLKPTTPPTLANSRGLPAKFGTIYVPYSEDHSILTAYQTANNWTGHASLMQEEPQ